jgi:hypothetical protein
MVGSPSALPRLCPRELHRGSRLRCAVGVSSGSPRYEKTMSAVTAAFLGNWHEAPLAKVAPISGKGFMGKSSESRKGAIEFRLSYRLMDGRFVAVHLNASNASLGRGTRHSPPWCLY